MTDGVRPPLPGRGEIDEAIHVISDHADRLFLWDYGRDRGQLVTLYNKAWVSHCTFLHGFDQNSLLQPASHAFGEPRIAWGGRFE